MYPHPDLASLVQLCDSFLLRLMPYFGIIAKEGNLKSEERRSLMDLSTSCLSSTGSVLLLAENNRLFDAERLLRSVSEGTIKFLYLICDPISFAAKHAEYSVILPKVAELKHHTIVAEKIAPHIKDTERDAWAPILNLILSDEMLSEKTRVLPSKLRREVENRWSFSQMIPALQKSALPFSPLLPGLFHTYSTASHLIHMDHIGVSISIDCSHINSASEAVKNQRHFERVISDCFSFALLRAWAIHVFLGVSTADLISMHREFELQYYH